MGMNDIFEPTKADFSQLADDKTLYVKNVEQMLSINIRTQSAQQLKSNLNVKQYRRSHDLEAISSWKLGKIPFESRFA
jgi:hypothetical protein